ncbi:MAG TPA: hypothetical protein VHX66_14625 [Solirubrobacteraceae bacterium]|nr:hypothetical protein [Solirubrobacteraceae bacterium]
MLDEKIAEVLGLAQAAQQATKKVAALARQEKKKRLTDLMQRMSEDARAVEARCQAAADARVGLKTAIAAEARDTKAEVLEFMKTYLQDAEALDGMEFLSMAEAGELAHWRILEKLNAKAKNAEVAKAIAFALPLQEKHVSRVAAASLELAAAEDPMEAA